MSEDPKEQGPKPPFEEQPQEPPGLEAEMTPRPDYGADSYRGHGRLEGKAAVITGGDSGIGRAVAVAFAREGADVLISYLEEEEPDAPYGVKGVGEPPTVVSTAAVVSALRAATGRDLTRVPVRPDDIVGL